MEQCDARGGRQIWHVWHHRELLALPFPTKLTRFDCDCCTFPSPSSQGTGNSASPAPDPTGSEPGSVAFTSTRHTKPVHASASCTSSVHAGTMPGEYAAKWVTVEMPQVRSSTRAGPTRRWAIRGPGSDVSFSQALSAAHLPSSAM